MVRSVVLLFFFGMDLQRCEPFGSGLEGKLGRLPRYSRGFCYPVIGLCAVDLVSSFVVELLTPGVLNEQQSASELVASVRLPR